VLLSESIHEIPFAKFVPDAMKQKIASILNKFPNGATLDEIADIYQVELNILVKTLSNVGIGFRKHMVKSWQKNPKDLGLSLFWRCFRK